MKYLIDIVHPHFVYFFKETIFKLGKENVIVTCQNSGIITNLLDGLGIKYIVIGKKYESLFHKAIGQFLYLLKFIKLIREHRIDIVLGVSPGLALACRLSGAKMIFFDDDDSAVQPLTKKYSIPLSHYIITPECLKYENYGEKHFTYRGYQELSYLAPKFFTPDESIIKKYQLEKYQYIILRFNDFKAHHDVGHSGMPIEVKRKLINLLQEYAKVYITTEGTIDNEFEHLQLNIKPELIHHIMHFALMYIGDSQTMASEAAVLGTPSIRCNTFKDKISYLKDLEYKYNLTFAFFPNESEKMISKIKILLETPELKKLWQEKKEKMLSEMENVNEYILNFIQKLNKLKKL